MKDLSIDISSILNFIKGLSGEHIALISVFVSFIIYILSKQSELNMKKYEAKKEHYIKLIDMLEKIFSKQIFRDGKNIKLTDDLRKNFFDIGSSLLFYGSKKIYRQYIFYRELSNNEIFKLSKYYGDDIITYAMADIFISIRKEVGLNKFDNISTNESLAFFVNDIANNPLSKKKSFEARHRIRMLKLEMRFIDLVSFVHLNSIYFKLIAPIFAVISLVFKYFILIPIGKIIIRVNPNFNEKLDDILKNYKVIEKQK